MSDPDPFGKRLPTLETQRLILRHPEQRDAQRVLAIFGDAQAMRYWSREPLTEIEQAVSYLDSIDRGFAERTLFQWGITRQSNDALLGTVTLASWSQQNRRAEVGYMLDPACWGEGIASEAVSAVLGFAFDQLNLHRIEADTDPRNTGSVALLERLGFSLEGTLRERWFTYGEWSDTQFFGLLRRDFLAAQDAGKSTSRS